MKSGKNVPFSDLELLGGEERCCRSRRGWRCARTGPGWELAAAPRDRVLVPSSSSPLGPIPPLTSPATSLQWGLPPARGSSGGGCGSTSPPSTSPLSVPPGERGRYHRGGGPERRRAEFRRDGGHGSRGGGVRGGALREAGGARLPGTAAGLQPRLQVGLAPLSWALSRCGVLLPPPLWVIWRLVPFLPIGCLLLLSQGCGGFAPIPVGYVGPAARCGAAKPAPSEVSLPTTPAPRPQRGFSIPPCVLRLLSCQPTAWTEGRRGRARL